MMRGGKMWRGGDLTAEKFPRGYFVARGYFFCYFGGMRIAIIADPVDEQNAGIHYYTKYLIENLLKIDRGNEYVLIHCRKNPIFGKWIAERKMRTDAGTFEVVIPSMRRLFGGATLRKFALLSFVFLKYKPDIVFEPAHIGPFSFLWKCKKVVAIQDLTPILFPQHHIFISRFIHKHLLPRIFKNADGVITPSESTKRDIERLYGRELERGKKSRLPARWGEQGEMMPERKDGGRAGMALADGGRSKIPIKVIPDAAAEFFKPADTQKIAVVRAKFQITKPYILSVGTLEPRKNLEKLAEVFQEMRREGQDIQWVVVGEKGWFYDELMRKLSGGAAERGGNLEENIILTGYVANEELAALYSGALCLVYPSLYEGFGLPVLEAMACFCPVICSNNSSLPEVCGDSAIMIDPLCKEALKTALRSILTSEKIRASLREKGILQAAKFSWKKCARETLTFFEQL